MPLDFAPAAMQATKWPTRGFTLIELMITVAIAGILVAVAIPQYNDYVTRSRWAGVVSQQESVKKALAFCAQTGGALSACALDETVTGVTPTAESQGLTEYFVSSQGNDVSATLKIEMVGASKLGSCKVQISAVVTSTTDAINWKTETAANNGNTCEKSRTGFSPVAATP